jgi:hypothetical protein
LIEPDEGLPHESSLLGMRQGYLNLALALLRCVAESDAGGYRDVEAGCAWMMASRELCTSSQRTALEWFVLGTGAGDLTGLMQLVLSPVCGVLGAFAAWVASATGKAIRRNSTQEREGPPLSRKLK